MNIMGDYHDLYLKIDLLLLADVFEKFISACLAYIRINMLLFIEEGMRGGISCIAKRHSKAINKYMKCYDSRKENKYIMYLDYYLGTFRKLNFSKLNNFTDNKPCLVILSLSMQITHLHKELRRRPSLCIEVWRSSNTNLYKELKHRLYLILFVLSIHT